MRSILLLSALLLFPVALAILLRFVRQKLGGGANWPLFFFLTLLGTAANNTAAVWFAGGGALLPSSGGFFGGDSLTAALIGLLLALWAAVGILICALPMRIPPRKPAPLAGGAWGWLLGQSLLSCAVFFMGAMLSFRSFSDRAGLPLALYLPLMLILIPAVGFGASLWLGGHSRQALFFPVAITAFFCGASAILLSAMLCRSTDPAWGLALIQTPGGLWYTRLNLPAAVLLGDYQYAWEFKPLWLWLSAVLPHLLFLLGWLGGYLLKPSETRQAP